VSRDVAGALLTGGGSRRLGRDKHGLVAGGETLAQRSARLLLEVCTPVVEVGPGVTSLPCVREAPPGAGPLAALAAAAGAVGSPLLLVAVDLPRMTASVLARLAGWPGDGTVIPVVGGRSQLVCARYGPAAIERAAVLLAAGERALRALEDGPDVTHAAGVFDADAAAFDDVDTEADALRLGLAWPGK
jgi:molybdopterin-guanine dinucleotide biosynthesis protein A